MKKIGLLIGFLAIIVVFATITVAAYFLVLLEPVASPTIASQQFVVPKGQAVQVIGQRLQDKGLIRYSWVFRLEVKRLGLAHKLQAGSFDLSPSMSMTELIMTLTKGTEDVWVTIPEGWRREELADSLQSLDLPLLDDREFLALTATREGMLFPDTYLVPEQISAQQMSDLLARTFEQKVLNDLAAEISASKYSIHDALIMASLIERESRGANEMREVAGVLWKRIEIGMPLQVDATLQYVKGYNSREKSWWSVPLAADKALKSPYNTYLNAGLPPGPISSPGVDAIKAALAPAHNEYLFYIHDNSGQIRLARTLDEHNANVQKYLR